MTFLGNILATNRARVAQCQRCMSHRDAILTQDLLIFLSRVVEGVEIEWIVDIFILHLGLAIRAGMMALVEIMDFSISATGHKWVLFHRVEIFYRNRRRKGRTKDRKGF